MTGRPTRVILKTRGSRNSAETTVQRPINARSLKDQKCIIKTILEPYLYSWEIFNTFYKEQ